MKQNQENYVGKKFSKWTVIEDLGRNKYNKRYMKCRCECGKEAEITLNSLKSGRSTSCRKCGSTKHGLSTDRLHRIWCKMLER